MKVLMVMPPAPQILDIQSAESGLEIASALARRGVDLYVLAPEEAITMLPTASGIRIVPWVGEQAVTLRKLIREVRPHIVQLEDSLLEVRALRQYYDGPVILNLHSMQPLAGTSITRRELRVAMCLVDRIVLVSHFLKSLFLGRYYGLRLRTSVVHPGVDTIKFSPWRGNSVFERERLLLRRSFGVTREKIVLYVGKPPNDHGLNVLLSAWQSIQKQAAVRLVVVTSNVRGLTSMVSLPADTIVLEQLSQECMPSVYRAADLFVYPAQGREAVGTVNLEAIASGLPIVASFRGGILEMIDDKCGWLVRQYADPGTWAKAITENLSETSLLAMGQWGRARSLKFTWDQAASKYLQLYGSRDT